MTLFIRTKDGNTIFEVEYWVKNTEYSSIDYLELSTSIDIKEYSKLLLEIDPVQRTTLISDFDQLSELRGWLWEVYFMTKQNVQSEYDNVLKELREFFKDVAERYDLYYVED